MPRQPRKVSESGIYHIMIRGNERKDIFLDEGDKQRFVDVLKKRKKDGGFKLYAMCIMNNHAHLLGKFEDISNLSMLMKKINTSYAYYYNKKFQRVGHVFQDRFKSEEVENDNHFLAAVRYIHNNPVKAGLVKEPWDYKWSSCGNYISTGSSLGNDILEKNTVLEMFSDEKNKAIKLFIEYMKQLNNDSFIDCEDEEEEINNILLGEPDAIKFINTYLKGAGLQLGMLKLRKNYGTRNKIIKELKEKSNLSIRQIAELLGLNKNTVLKVR